MKLVFIIILFSFSAIESFVLKEFTLKKESVAKRSTTYCYVFLWLAVIAAFVFGLHIPYIAFIFLMLSYLLHSYLGYYLNRFNRSKKFDRIVHGFGAFSSAIFAFYLLSNFVQYGGSKIFLAIYMLLLGISIGSVYEIIEFQIDRKHAKKLQRGLKDTDMDMVSNIVGALVAAAFALIVL